MNSVWGQDNGRAIRRPTWPSPGRARQYGAIVSGRGSFGRRSFGRERPLLAWGRREPLDRPPISLGDVHNQRLGVVRNRAFVGAIGSLAAASARAIIGCGRVSGGLYDILVVFFRVAGALGAGRVDALYGLHGGQRRGGVRGGCAGDCAGAGTDRAQDGASGHHRPGRRARGCDTRRIVNHSDRRPTSLDSRRRQ